jgi:hypothetical protein
LGGEGANVAGEDFVELDGEGGPLTRLVQLAEDEVLELGTEEGYITGVGDLGEGHDIHGGDEVASCGLEISFCGEIGGKET